MQFNQSNNNIGSGVNNAVSEGSVLQTVGNSNKVNIDRNKSDIMKKIIEWCKWLFKC
jgi:hypothetical protein